MGPKSVIRSRGDSIAPDGRRVRNLVKGHGVDVLHGGYAVNGYGHHTLAVGLNDAHLAAGEVGYEHAEGDGDEQQGLVLLDNTEIEKHKGQQVHDEEHGVLAYGSEGGHLIELLKDFHYCFHYI